MMDGRVVNVSGEPDDVLDGLVGEKREEIGDLKLSAPRPTDHRGKQRSVRSGCLDVVEELIEDSERRNQMGEAGRKRVTDEYYWERESEKLLHIYSELTQR